MLMVDVADSHGRAQLSEDLQTLAEGDMRRNDRVYRKFTLHKIEADIRHQLSFAEKQLLEAEIQMDATETETDEATRRCLRKELRQ
jgi:hypothetical protein